MWLPDVVCSVEQVSHNPLVRGSTPRGPTNKKQGLRCKPKSFFLVQIFWVGLRT